MFNPIVPRSRMRRSYVSVCSAGEECPGGHWPVSPPTPCPHQLMRGPFLILSAARCPGLVLFRARCPPPSRDNMNMTTQHLPRPTVNTAHCAAAGHLCGDTRICSRASNEGSRSLKFYNHQARRRPIPYDLCVVYPILH